MSQIWAIFFVIFVNMLGFGVIIPLAPTFQITFNLTAMEYGVLGAMFPLVQMISAPVLGRISDRVGRRPVMITSFLFVSLSYLILAFAKTYPVLLISRIVGGFFSGSFVVAMACAADISDVNNRRKYIGIAGMGFGFGFMLGPTIGGIFAGNNPYQANIFQTAMFSLVLSILGTIIILLLLKETLKKKHNVTTTIFQEVRGIITKREDLINFFLSAVISMVLAGIEVFLSLLMSRKFLFSPQEVGIFWGVFSIVMNVGRMALLKFLYGNGGVIICFGSMVFATLGYTYASTLGWIYLWSCVIALFAGALITLINSSISLNADPSQQGLFLGLSNAAGNIGRTIAPTSMGFLIHKSHGQISSGWIFLTIMCTLATMTAYYNYKKAKPSLQ